MEDLHGRAAFITGGARGIGLGIARSLAREGVRLALADINDDALEQARRELADQTEVCVHQLDVRDRGCFVEVADAVEAELGPVTLLFNNAGVASKMSVKAMSYDVWDWSLGINLGGVVNGIQTWLPRMLEHGDGHIVNTASAAGLVVPDRHAGFLYPTAKYGVVGLSEGLRHHLEPHGIGVSVLCPGVVATDLYDNTAEGYTESGDWTPHLDRLRQALKQGPSIDAVGQIVIDGIRQNRLFLLTDRTVERALNARVTEVLGSVPVVAQ